MILHLKKVSNAWQSPEARFTGKNKNKNRNRFLQIISNIEENIAQAGNDQWNFSRNMHTYPYSDKFLEENSPPFFLCPEDKPCF